LFSADVKNAKFKLEKYLLLLVSPEKNSTVVLNLSNGDLVRINQEISWSSCLLKCPVEIQEKLANLGFLLPVNFDGSLQEDNLPENISPPLRLALATTYTCNLACSYCFVPEVWKIWDRPIPNQNMSSSLVPGILKFIDSRIDGSSISGLHIEFIGLGEPLIFPDIIINIYRDIFRHFRDTKTKITSIIVTNGTLLTENIVEVLARYSPLYQITIDGSRSIHDQQRKTKSGKGTYNQILKSLRILRSYSQDVAIRINVTSSTVKNFGRLLDDLGDIGCDGWPISVHPVLPGSPDCFSLSLYSDIDNSSACIEVSELLVRRGFLLALTPFPRRFPCLGSTPSSYAIDMFGDIYPCEGVIGNLSLRIGNLSLESGFQFLGGWPSDPELPCQSCRLQPLCGGKCPAWRLFGFPPEQCTKDREFLVRQALLQLARCYPDWFEFGQLDKWEPVFE